MFHEGNLYMYLESFWNASNLWHSLNSHFCFNKANLLENFHLLIQGSANDSPCLRPKLAY